MAMDSPADIKSFALRRARELGLVLAGIAPAGPAGHGQEFRQWLAEGRQGSMAYMARHLEKRLDVRVEYPWARSVLCVAGSYAPPDARADGPIARYARGRDYHKVLKGLCHQLADELIERVPGLRTRTCTDTAPLLERSYAVAGGLGWIGKNTCLIHPGLGSYLLLAEIVLSVSLPADEPMADHCGSCGACLQACPTGALFAPHRLDARLCISWATIEHPGPLVEQSPAEQPANLPGPQFPGGAFDTHGQLFGCDICQSVCPHNQAVTPGLPRLVEHLPLAGVDVQTVLAWSPEEWDLATRSSASRRATYPMFLRNACLVAGRERLADTQPLLLRLAEHADPAVASSARWAIAQFV